MQLHAPSALALSLTLAGWACSSSTTAIADQGGGDAGGGDGGMQNDGGDGGGPGLSELPESFLFFRGSAKAVDGVTGEVFPLAENFDSAARAFSYLTGFPALERSAFVADVLISIGPTLHHTSAIVERDNSGAALPPALQEVGTLDFDIFSFLADVDPSTNELFVLTDTATGWSLFELDAERNPSAPRPFPGDPITAILNGASHGGWLARKPSGELTHVDTDSSETVLMGATVATHLASTPGGDQFIATEDGLFRYDAEAKAFVKLFDGVDASINQLLVDSTPEGLVVGIREDEGLDPLTSLYLLVDEIVTDPFHDVEAAVDSIVFAGERVVYSARFEAENEQRIESVTLDGIDVDVVATGDVPTFLPGSVFASNSIPYLYFNSGLPFEGGGAMAHAARIDGTESMEFEGARWIGAFLERSNPSDVETIIRIDDVGVSGVGKAISAVDAEDPTSETLVGTTGVEVLDAQMSLGLGVEGLLFLFVEDENERDAMLIELSEDEPGGGLLQITFTPDIDEGPIFFDFPLSF